ncbi:MAG: hypothetical protein KIT58_20385, partial [Planctomycetota bacterium]|nr:hypothetical protein [Planctomycetota bacterium]
AFLFTPGLPQSFVNMLVPIAAAALALAAALPAAPVAWTVAHTERVATLSLPQVVPAALAVGLTLSGLAFVVALAVRLASRPDQPPEALA